MIYNTYTYIIHILHIFIAVLYYSVSPLVLVHIIDELITTESLI